MVGTIGSGKTTELLRVHEARQLKEFVVFLDLARYFEQRGSAESLQHVRQWEVCLYAALVIAGEYTRHWGELPSRPLDDIHRAYADVARAAGVSTATVSRAINKPQLVSQEVRQRVVAMAEQLGWVPHGTARALSTRRSGAIGAVFPALTHGDFARAATAVQAELQRAGYTLLLACSNYDLGQEYEQVRKIGRAHV